jgi:hypothetical protein
MIKLRCLSDYKNHARRLGFEAGQEIEVEPVTATFLLADSPESFEEIGERAAAVPFTAENDSTKTYQPRKPRKSSKARHVPRSGSTSDEH